MTGSRRSARPVRISLATQLGSDIDGAWWPHTASIAGELPGLIEALHRPLGEIIDISINWSAIEGSPDLDSMTTAAMSRPGWHGRSQRLMIIAGRRARAKILVVPCMTTRALGLMVLRQAAAIPISPLQQENPEFATADYVVRTARAQSASWAGVMVNTQVGESRTAALVHSGHLSPDLETPVG